MTRHNFLFKNVIKDTLPARSLNVLPTISGYYWVSTTARYGVPSSAVRGGVDQDGTQIYVGKAYHEGDWIPAKVIPEKKVAYVAYGGQEHAKSEYQVKMIGAIRVS